MFLTCGDALFDLFVHPGKGIGDLVLDGHVGGSPLNVALGLSRLGNRAGFLCKNSSDLFGQRIRAHLDANGVLLDWMVPTPLNSTLAIVQLDDTGAATYVFHIHGTADVSIELADLPSALPDDLDVLHVASYTTVTEPTASSLLELIRREKHKRLISYDPNVRLPIEPDIEIWRARYREIAACCDVIKASDEDVAMLQGIEGKASRTDFDRFSADAFDAGASLVMITRGGDGGYVYASDGRSEEAHGITVNVKDTVGAGDTFQASSLHWLKASGAIANGTLSLGDSDLADLADFAACAAAITCSRVGADLPSLADVEKFRAQRRG